MNKYNERVLKNVLEDIREENDINLQKEAEKAATNPRFANNDESDKRFYAVLEELNKTQSRKQHRKTFLRVASVFLAILIGFSAVTLSVKAFREKLWEIISNISNPSYSLFVTSDEPKENLLSEYEGIYIPTWIPDGYEIVSISNKKYSKNISYKNKDGKTISFTEHTQNIDKKLNLDKEDFDSYEVYNKNNTETIIATKSHTTTLIIKEQGLIIHVAFDDKNIDIKAFAEMIEKK